MLGWYHGGMANQEKPRRAAIYVRISQDRNGEGLGVKRQREDCLRLAKRLGWVVHEDRDAAD